MRWLLPLVVVMLACDGPTGPAGTEGEPGEPGPGTRVVYSGVPIEGFKHANIPLPDGLTLQDPPVMSCYMGLDPDDQLIPADLCMLGILDGHTPIVQVHVRSTDHAYRVVLVY